MTIQESEATKVIIMDFINTLDPHRKLEITYSFDKDKQINEVVDMMTIAGMIREASDDILKLTPHKEPTMPKVKKNGPSMTAEELKSYYGEGVFLAVEDMVAVISNIYKAISEKFDIFTSDQIRESMEVIKNATKLLKKTGISK